MTDTLQVLTFEVQVLTAIDYREAPEYAGVSALLLPFLRLKIGVLTRDYSWSKRCCQ